MAIRIVTDSYADLPLEVARDNDITVVPLYVNIGGDTYRDGVDIDADRFYSLLEQLPGLPTTSQPSVADFASVYQRLLDEGHQVVSIHVSGKLSGTLNSATQARASLGDPPQIAIVDSWLAGGAQALLALSAAQRALETTDVGEVARQAGRSIERNHSLVVVDTLKYLQRGGRIGRVQAFLGGALKFKPIISVRDGEPHPVERTRTRRRAIARIISLARDLGAVSRLHVSYSTGREGAQAVIAGLSELVEPDDIIESRFGPVLGTHLGPNTIGVALSQPEPEAYSASVNLI